MGEVYPVCMNPHDPEVARRHDKIKNLLEGGMPISEAAKEAGLSRKRVYDLADKYNLPYNKPVRSGGRLERKIVELSASGFDNETIGQMFRMSVVAIGRVLERVRVRVRNEA